jgi:FixJ family two-component response regulator
MDGLDLQRCVRLERPDLPVIFITGHHDDEVERSAFAQGAAFLFVNHLMPRSCFEPSR